MELNGATLVRVPTSLDDESVRGFQSALRRARSDSAGVVVLQGSAPALFCRGLDLSALHDVDGVARSLEQFAHCLRAIRAMDKTVVSVVAGEAKGGGVGIAAAADAVLATPAATFALPELLFGLTPAIVLPYLAERVSVQKLRWLALSSRAIDAHTALRLGLVDEVADEADAARTLAAWVRRLTRLDGGVVSLCKRMTMARPDVASNDGVALTADRLRDPEVRDRIARFLDAGEPPWRTGTS